MKICGQEMKVTLSIHGREKTFSEQELIAILEKHFSNEAIEQATTANVAQVPTEEQWFEVNPQAIDHSLFHKKRRDERQEKIRWLIVDAFDAVKSSPEKYDGKFKTMMPKKTWSSKTIADLRYWACQLGGYNADWVEQALEWAQRICNGETWEAICNNADTAKWYRVIIWKNGQHRIVGGSRNSVGHNPASDIGNRDYGSVARLYSTVPLVVLREK